MAQLFNAVQRSSAATERCVKHLWKIAQQCPEEAIQALAGCIELVLTAGQVRGAPRTSTRAALNCSGLLS